MSKMMSKVLWPITIAVCFLSACSGSSSSSSGGQTSSTNGAPAPNTVSGTVRFQGVPMAGVTVTAVNTNSNPSTFFGSTTTDANGDYTITGLSTACTCTVNYQLFATKAGYAFVPVMKSDPSGSVAGYLWNPAPSNWYVNVGAAVTRAQFNGQFTNPNGGAPIIFTVINFNSTTNNSVTGADFNAYDGTNSLVSLAATGQQTSYAAGDDGSLKRGVAWPGARFVDNHDGTVTDNLTGLIWLKNAGCLAPAVWANAVAEAPQLASGSCGLTDGSTPGQWRLPNLGEMESIIDVSASNPALTPGNPFTNVSGGMYWTSTYYWGGSLGSTEAWVIQLSDGSYVNDATNNVMATSNNAVWAVKGPGGGTVKLQATGNYIPTFSGDDGSTQSGAPLTFPRMRDNGDGTITDTVTGLIWLKMAACINQTWAGALAAVNGLASGQCGLSDGSKPGDWRMPNRNEMQSLSDRGIQNHAEYFDEYFISGTTGINSQPNIFVNMIQLQYFWTSTTNASNTSDAWTVFSCDFGVYSTPKGNTGYTFAVR